MNERQMLLGSISSTVSDYRAGEIAAPTPTHVDRWVRQFEPDVQVPLLRELDQVLKQTYFSRAFFERFLGNLVRNADLVGENPRDFWKHAKLLEIQQNGNSQREMLALFEG